MEYTKIPYVGKKISRLVYGTAAEPFQSGGDGRALLDAVYAAGVNTFDTARGYGNAESSLGRWIEERGLRGEVVILSKGAHPDRNWRSRVNEREIREDFARSAQELRTDYIDIYLLHRDDPQVEAGVCVEILNAMHAEGKIGAFGGSNWTHTRIMEANEYAYSHNLIPFTVSSPNFSLARQVTDPWGGGAVSISGPGQRAVREWYAREGMAVMVYSSLARGLFSGKIKSADRERAEEYLDPFAVKGYVSDDNFERLHRCERLAARKGCSVSQIAMAWIFQQNMNLCAIMSTSKEARMRENIGALDLKLSAEELDYLDLATEEQG